MDVLPSVLDLAGLRGPAAAGAAAAGATAGATAAGRRPAQRVVPGRGGAGEGGWVPACKGGGDAELETAIGPPHLEATAPPAHPAAAAAPSGVSSSPGAPERPRVRLEEEEKK